VKFWHDTRLLNMLANGLIALTLAVAVACGGWWLVQRPGHALRSVSIDAMPGTDMRHVSSLLLGQAVRQRLKGNFFTVDLDLVRAGFEQVPWVRRATVRRIWPNRLAVSIEEHRPLALWGDGRLLNTFGELYTANLAEAEEDGPLPHFAGPPGSESRVLTRYEEMRRWLAPLGRTPQALVLSARYAWAAQLDDGTRLMLGRDQGLPIEERVGRWVSAYPRVKARLAERAQIVDLRYPNGFAVRAMVPGPVSGKVGAAGPAGASKDDTARLPAGEGSALLAAFTEQGAAYP
jgi:cell division protein FtsQ